MKGTLSKEEKDAIFQNLWSNKIFKRGINLPPTFHEFKKTIEQAEKLKERR